MTDYLDARQLADGEPLEAEVCIIGAGAAGLTIARQLAGTAARVAIVEAGGMWFSRESQDLYDVEHVGSKYPMSHLSRLRFFGGTTNHWGGLCLPIRASIFEKRPWIPHSGWPFGRALLDPYYERAYDFMRIGKSDFDFAALTKAEKLDPLPFDESRLRTRFGRVNRIRFGKEFVGDLADAPNITVYLNANVASINRDRTAGRINGISIKTLDGKAFDLSAKVFILACGGIENPRLLLNSRQVEAAGLGNGHDLIGRYFMDHIWYPRSEILPADQSREYRLYTDHHLTEDDWYMHGFFDLPAQAGAELQIGDFRTEIEGHRSLVCDPVARRARTLLDDVMQGKPLNRIKQKLIRVVTNYDTVWRYMTEGEDGPLTYRLLNYSEQVPNPESRVMLSTNRDALGLNKAALAWRLSEIDIRTITEGQKIVAREVGRSEFGRVKLERIPAADEESRDRIFAAFHHMGTTRMDPNPRLGVVDSDCRMHGLGNFYVAGSSVFPCSGYQNPTFTILALAMRISDHVKSQLDLG